MRLWLSHGNKAYGGRFDWWNRTEEYNEKRNNDYRRTIGCSPSELLAALDTRTSCCHTVAMSMLDACGWHYA